MFIEKINQNLEQKAKNTLLLDLKTLKVQPHLIGLTRVSTYNDGLA